MRAVITPDDLKRSDLMEPGWNPAEISSYEEKPASTDGSTNCIFHFKVLEGNNKGATPRTLLSEKAFGFGKNLFAALNLPKDAKGGYEVSTELFQAQVGKKLQIYVVRGKNKDTGAEFNDVKDFRPMS